MFVHSVYFWLRDDLVPEEREAFVQGASALKRIDSVRHGYLGVPAPTDRAIIDRSYSYALTLVFEDQEGHDRYQVDPVHDRFREECAPYWTKVLIYDSVEQR